MGMACAGGSGEPAVPIPDLSFAPELDIDLDQMSRSPSGLYIQDMEVGRGEEARPNRRVTVHYIGWFPDGRAFESSVEAGAPVRFTLGAREVIRGWEEGIRGMREGGRRKLVIPPRLAYGRGGLDNLVPSNAVLVFQIQLLAVER
jgi:FKBP-type peptidyl-prolyl cis-trans isomerase